MALVKCIECNKEISDKAPACPHCGISVADQHITTNTQTKAPTSNTANKEIFKADGHNFVLSEITSLSEVTTRTWAVMVLLIPLLVLNIYAWQSFDSWMAPTAILVVSIFVFGIFYTNDGSIYSTGSVHEISDSMAEISQDYQSRVNVDDLVKYSQKTLLLNINFTINPNRVASYTSFTTSDHWLFYAIGAASLGLSGYTGNEIFAGGAIFLVFGFLARRGGIVINGVGGNSEKIFTRMKDIEAIEQELAEKIASR